MRHPAPLIFETRHAARRPAGGARDCRDLPFDLCEVKFAKLGNGDPTRFEGYASVWGRVDSYGDTVLRGAFEESLKGRRPMMFFGHSPGRVPGKWVDIAEDDKGLRVVGELTPGHSEAADLEASLRHGSISGLSIGGYTTDWAEQSDGGRIIRAFDLWEISVVSMPAETEARVDAASIKSALDSCDSIADMETLLREAAGFSKSMATAFVARMRRLTLGEPAGGDALEGADELLEALKNAKLPPLILEKLT